MNGVGGGWDLINEQRRRLSPACQSAKPQLEPHAGGLEFGLQLETLLPLPQRQPRRGARPQEPRSHIKTSLRSGTGHSEGLGADEVRNEQTKSDATEGLE